MRTRLLTVCFLLATPTAVQGGSWLIADRDAVNDGEDVWLSAVAGELFPFGDGPPDPAGLVSFLDRCDDDWREIAGYATQDRGLSLREPMHGGGTHVIGCAWRPTELEGPIGAFSGGPSSSRAGELPAGREARASTAGSGPQRRIRFAKTIVDIYPTDPDQEAYALPLGHALEIIPMSHPCHWRAGTTVHVVVTLDGHPWPGVEVTSGRAGMDASPARTTTDAEGIASMFLGPAGHWFIEAQLVRPASSLARVQSERLEATLTFHVEGNTDVNETLRAIRAIHGTLDPWAAAGYRMGRRALRELELSRGDRDLLAVHVTPFESPYVSIADGVQAATGASAGTLTLRLAQAPATELRIIFTDRATGDAVTIRLDERFVEMMLDTETDDWEAAALQCLVLSDEEMFGVTRAPEPLLTASLPRTPAGVTRSDEGWQSSDHGSR